MVTFQLFARAALELLAGQTDPRLPIVYAQLESAFQHKPGLTRFLPARLRENGALTARAMAGVERCARPGTVQRVLDSRS